VESLVHDYFERDLNDLEEQRLEDSILKDAGVAEALCAAARERYLSFGLPDPLKPAPEFPYLRVSWTRSWGWGLALAAGLLLGAFISPWSRQKPPLLPGVQAQWTASALGSGAKGLGFASALAKAQVPVELTLAQRELVVVKVVAKDGRILRILHAGPLPAGHQTLLWDRVDQDGRLVTNGSWRIVVEEGLPLAPEAKP
jgi:hypothetical protein